MLEIFGPKCMECASDDAITIEMAEKTTDMNVFRKTVSLMLREDKECRIC